MIASGSMLVGLDIGGSGSRIACCSATSVPAPRRLLRGRRVAVSSGGSSLAAIAGALLRAAAGSWPAEIAGAGAIALGATGIATLVDDPTQVAVALRAELAALVPPGETPVPVVVAADAVTAHLGALRGEPGAIVALGTGAIALGTDGRDVWRRVDGWGHLLGDRGGGAWIGLAGLKVAVLAHDGVDPAGQPLLEAARARFGDPPTWPGQLYRRDDRAGVLAGFAPDVAAVAQAGDPAAAAILTAAGAAAARSGLAALGADLPPVLAPTGGLFAAAGVREAFDRTIAALRPDAAIVEPFGDPLDGALHLAARAAGQTTRPGLIWAAPAQAPDERGA